MVSKTITLDVTDAEQSTGTVTINWGDGSTNTTITNADFNGNTIQSTHDYTTDGNYTITVTADDLQSSNNTGTSTYSVTVTGNGGGSLPGVLATNEITEWKTRKNSTMVSEWNRTVGIADHFKNNDAWFGKANEALPWRPSVVDVYTSPLTRDPATNKGNPPWSTFQEHSTIITCGFVGMLYTEDGNSAAGTPYIDAVKNYLKDNANATELDFTRTDTWLDSYYISHEVNNMDVAMIIGKWARAYSFIRSYISAADQSIIDPWILSAGQWCEKWVTTLRNKSFTGTWYDGSAYYTSETVPFYYDREGGSGYDYGGALYDGGPAYHPYGFTGMENRHLMAMGSAAVVGLALNDSFLLDRARLYYQQAIRDYLIGDRADPSDFVRAGFNKNANRGFNYGFVSLNGLYRMADAVYRRGVDTNIFEYSTTGGWSADGRTSASTTPKSLKRAIDSLLEYGTRNPTIYRPGYAGDATQVFDSQDGADDPNANSRWIQNSTVRIWGQYYQDTKIDQYGNFTATGLPPKGPGPADEYSTETADFVDFYTEGPTPFIYQGMPKPV